MSAYHCRACELHIAGPHDAGCIYAAQPPMTRIRITWTRPCEYVADVDTAELREVVSALPGRGREKALRALGGIEGGALDGAMLAFAVNSLAHVINSTETGREWLGGMADDNPGYLGGTGAPEVTEIRPALTEDEQTAENIHAVADPPEPGDPDFEPFDPARHAEALAALRKARERDS